MRGPKPPALTLSALVDPARRRWSLRFAIRLLVERETLLEAEKAWQRYLDHGAPLGHADEVRAFLRTRQATASVAPAT